MPKSGPQTVFDIQKAAGKITGKVDLAKTYTNDYVLKAQKLEHIGSLGSATSSPRLENQHERRKAASRAAFFVRVQLQAARRGHRFSLMTRTLRHGGKLRHLGPAPQEPSRNPVTEDLRAAAGEKLGG